MWPAGHKFLRSAIGRSAFSNNFFSSTSNFSSFFHFTSKFLPDFPARFSLKKYLEVNFFVNFLKYLHYPIRPFPH